MRINFLSPSFILEGSAILASLSKQLNDLRDGRRKEGETNSEEKHLKKGELWKFDPPLVFLAWKARPRVVMQ